MPRQLGKEIREITVYLKRFPPDGRVVPKGKRQLGFGYRSLNLEPGEVIISGGIKLSPGMQRIFKKKPEDFGLFKGGQPNP